MIPVFHPRLSLTLRKVQRRLDAERLDYLAEPVVANIDLTDYLAENSNVTVSRGISQPGVFSITLADKVDQRSLDSLYALIEPMDLIDIRMGHASGPDLPAMVMRGVVSSISRSESVGADGKPSRTVVVSGHDFSKFLQTTQICYQSKYPLGEYALSILPMAESYGLWLSNTASEFVVNVMDALVSGEKGFLSSFYRMSGLGSRVKFLTEATVTGARVGPYGMQPYEGDVWGLLNNWTDIGWNELFVEDREDATYLIYRPAPYYRLGTNELVLADCGARDPGTIEVPIADVESLHLGRSDQDVANFFQVDAPQAELINGEMMHAAALDDGMVYVQDHANCDPKIFGLKRMPARTQQGPDGSYPRAKDATNEEKQAMAKHFGLWYGIRREQLKALHIDNAVLEQGSATLRGNENIRPGVYIRMKRGALQSRYYVTHVTHQYMPFRSFKTTVELARGEGYADRRNLAGSPYFNERGAA